MAKDNTSIPSTSLVKHPDILMSVGVVGILMVMLVPLPRFFLDLLLSFNITLSIIILLVGMQVRRPLEFSVFPSILLMVTLLRLALNIASTRLILLHGNEGAAAAGEVIRAFGNFVVGGNYTVGLVVFTILVIINFVVITAAASSCNSGIFSTGRMLYTLAHFGQAPAAFGKVSRNHIPATGITVSVAVMLFGVVLNYFIPEKVFVYVTSVALIGTIYGGDGAQSSAFCHCPTLPLPRHLPAAASLGSALLRHRAAQQAPFARGGTGRWRPPRPRPSCGTCRRGSCARRP